MHKMCARYSQYMSRTITITLFPRGDSVGIHTAFLTQIRLYLKGIPLVFTSAHRQGPSVI